VSGGKVESESGVDSKAIESVCDESEDALDDFGRAISNEGRSPSDLGAWDAIEESSAMLDVMIVARFQRKS